MKNVKWHLFLDDERFPRKKSYWTIARSSIDAQALVEMNGIPEEIAFDHDLGGQDTSRDFCRWLTDFMIDNDLKFPSNFTFSVHSQNPIGAKWITSYMNSLIHFRGKR